MGFEKQYRTVTGKLSAARAAWRLNAAFQGAVAAVACACLPVFAGAALGISGTARLVLLAVAAASSCAAVIIAALYPLARPLSLVDVSLLAEKKHPSLENKLTTAVQLRLGKGGEGAYDAGMLAALYEEASRAAAGLRIRTLLDLRRTFAALAAAAVLTGSFAAVLAVRPGFGRKIAGYVAPPYFPRAEIFAFGAVTGDMVVQSGAPAEISARMSGVVTGAPEILIEREGLEPRSERMLKAASLQFRHKIPTVTGDMTYTLIYKTARSGPWRITSVEPPRVRSLKVKLIYPEYAGMPSEELDNTGDIAALAGTRAVFTVSSTAKLRSARIEAGGKRIPLRLDRAGGGGSASITVTRDVKYTIRLVDTHGFTNRMPPAYTIHAIPDAPPVIEITQPGADVTVPGPATLLMHGAARDDYGVASVTLHYKLLSGKRAGAARVPIKPGPDCAFDFPWDLAAAGFLQGDTVEYRFTATDNNTATGPRLSSTPAYRIVIMTRRAEYEKIEQANDQVISRLESAVKESGAVAENFKSLSQSLASRKDTGMKKSEDVQRALDRQKALEQELSEISEQMQENISHMKENDLVSLEALQKMTAIRQLMDQIATKEMKELMNKLQQAVKNVDINQLDRTLMESMKDQEKLLRNLDNTLQRLKRIQSEQKLGSLAKQMDELTRRQKDALEQTSALKEKQNKGALGTRDRAALDRLAREEREIKESLGETRKKIDEAEKAMSESSPETARDLRDAMRDFDAKDAPQSLEKAENDLKGERAQSAEKNERDAYEAMLSLTSGLSDAKSSYGKKTSEAVKRMIAHALRKTLDLSDDQEKTLDDTARLAQRPGRALTQSDASRINTQVRFQRDVLTGLAKDLYALSNLSMDVSPGLAMSAVNTAALLDGALDMIKENRLPDANSRIMDSYRELNRIALALLEAKSGGQGGGGQGEMEQFMQQLQSLADAQENLNEMTSKLGSSGMPIPSMSNALQSLAVQQQMLKQGVGKLMQDARGMGEMEKRLSQIQEKMEEIEKELRDGWAGGEITRRQSDVLRRLKDATLSLKKESLEEKRLAETGKQYSPVSPAAAKAKQQGGLPPEVMIELESLKKESKQKGFEGAIENYYRTITAPR